MELSGGLGYCGRVKESGEYNVKKDFHNCAASAKGNPHLKPLLSLEVFRIIEHGMMEEYCKLRATIPRSSNKKPYKPMSWGTTSWVDLRNSGV